MLWKSGFASHLRWRCTVPNSYFPNLTTDNLKSREGNRKQPPAGEWLHVVKFNRLKIQLTNSTITINGQKLYWAHGTPTIISLRVWRQGQSRAPRCGKIHKCFGSSKINVKNMIIKMYHAVSQFITKKTACQITGPHPHTRHTPHINRHVSDVWRCSKWVKCSEKALFNAFVLFTL